MALSKLRILFEDYLYESNSFEGASIISSIVEEVFKSGFDANALEYFSKEYNEQKKQTLIRDIFKELDYTDETQKFQITDTLSSFLIETTLIIQDQILPVYFKSLSDKRDFRLVFTTLKIFTTKWDEFSDKLKKDIYKEFLKVLDNPFDIFIEEGIYEITKIVLNSKSSISRTKSLFSEEEIDDYLKIIIRTASKSKTEPLYAALESIEQVLESNSTLISKEIYNGLSPLFKKISKKITILYSAKRSFVKVSLSFINLILKFEKDFCDENYINGIKSLISKTVKTIDHANVKYLLELIILIMKNTNNLPKIDVIRPTFQILRDFHQKKDRMEAYINNLVEELINLIWPLINDQDKDIFFQEIEFGSSRV